MSTRALYTVKGPEGNFNIYKHHDGYPSGAVRTIKTAIDWFAWRLPRYESDEFAASFCAAAKLGWLETADDDLKWLQERGPGGKYPNSAGGGIRLMPSGNPTKVACKNCSDIEYRYEISWDELKDHLHIKAISGNWWDKAEEEVIFNGKFDDFYAQSLKKVAAAT